MSIDSSEEVWLYVSDKQPLMDLMDYEPNNDIPGMVRSFLGSILATRSPYRSRITAKQELWYAVVRARMELDSVEFSSYVGQLLSDVYTREFEEALQSDETSTDSVNTA